MTPEKPTSPNDMPSNWHDTDPNWRWNVLATLDCHSCVDIHWENDWHVSNQTGEPAGTWDVMIETCHGKRFSCSHPELENAIWYVTTLAENSDSEEWKKKDDERIAALAKLSERERKLLGISGV